MKTRHLLVASVMVSIAMIEFSVASGIDLAGIKIGQGTANTTAAASGGEQKGTEASAAPVPAYDVSHLLKPSKKFFGVSLGGDPTAPKSVAAWTERVGKKPNMLTIFASFDDKFAASQARVAYQQGALPVLRWEPFKPKIADIAAGKYDAYITEFATSVRKVNVPTVFTFAHEMNGGWYSWGTKKVKASDYVAAWRHIHRLFEKADATNVIWAWTPNVINPVPSVKLKPLYPGDDYVDWIGIDGYYTNRGANTYDTLYGPTKTAIRKFTKKPFIIVETGAEPGGSRSAWIKDLVKNVADDDEMLGFVYFNQNGSAPWKIDADSSALSTMRKQAASANYGFTVR